MTDTEQILLEIIKAHEELLKKAIELLLKK